VILSDTRCLSGIESAYEDIDYRGKVKRSQFETAASELKVRFTGGASRTHMIQQAVKSTAGEDKVAVNVNADEAAVLGTGLYGAGLSRQFKTKEIKVSDVYMYDIQVTYTTVPKDGGSPKTISSTIFPSSSKTGSKKTLTFKRKDDLSIKLSYVLAKQVASPSLTRSSPLAIILRELWKPK
jgi:hypoxia up-regulated 1